MYPLEGLVGGRLQVSLMVHPDKCSHVRAKEAFEVLSSANSDLQSDERRREVIHVLNMAKGGDLGFPFILQAIQWNGFAVPPGHVAPL